MKTLLTKLYFIVMGPLYRRLSRESALRIQELQRVQLEFQERFTARVCDQMIALSVANSTSLAAGEAVPLTDAEIIEIVAEITKSEDLVALSKRLEIPLKHVVEVYSRYGGMNPTSIRTLLQMEERNRNLAKTLIESASDSELQSALQVDVSPTRPTKR